MHAPEAHHLADSVRLAAQMLVEQNAVTALTLDEAIIIVSAMRPKRLPAGTTLITEGEAEFVDYMVLVLSGDVRVESQGRLKSENVIDVVGPGAILGEMSLIDGQPRLATCTAQTDLSVAVLTRDRLRQLLQSQPEVAAKFLLFLHARASRSARVVLNKFNTVLKMNEVMHQQLNVLMNARTMPSAPTADAPAES